jgi:3-hydroxyisobutyrate dehydrogenase-like beta-hydroxyacid dehydrogenase
VRVSVLGLGIIGSAWAKNLIEDGLDVRCWNRTPRDFPGSCESARDAVAGADFVIIVVADPHAVDEVLKQISSSLKAGTTVLQASTISAEDTRRFARELTAVGAAFLETPFTGSRPAAEQRKTVFYTGGNEAVLDRARPLLERLSSRILHVGPLGSASSLKLALNVNAAAVAQGLCESLALCRAEGIDDDTFFAALKLNASHSPLADLKEPKLRMQDFAPQFSVKHMLKDLRLAASTAAGAGVDLPQNELLVLLYEQALTNGWGEEDYIGLVRLVSRQQGR